MQTSWLLVMAGVLAAVGLTAAQTTQPDDADRISPDEAMRRLREAESGMRQPSIKELRERVALLEGAVASLQADNARLRSELLTVTRERDALRPRQFQAEVPTGGAAGNLRLQETPAPAQPPRALRAGPMYLGVGVGHWIDQVSGNGRIITLEDRSVWEVSPLDRIDTALWLGIDDVIVLDGRNPSYPYKMVNKSQQETADVRLLSK